MLFFNFLRNQKSFANSLVDKLVITHLVYICKQINALKSSCLTATWQRRPKNTKNCLQKVDRVGYIRHVSGLCRSKMLIPYTTRTKSFSSSYNFYPEFNGHKPTLTITNKEVMSPSRQERLELTACVRQLNNSNFNQGQTNDLPVTSKQGEERE